jgi:hypothetical protein
VAAASSAGAARAASPEASPEPLVLAWSAPGDCPPAAEVKRRVAAQLPASSRVHVDGQIERSGARYRLSLAIETAGTRGERVLEADTCEELVTSAAVVIGMSAAAAVEDDAREPAPEPDASDPPAPPPREAQATRAAAPAPPTREAPRERGGEGPGRRFALRAQLVGEAGTLPSAGLGGGLAVAYAPLERLRVELALGAWASQQATLDADATRGARFRLLGGTARACLALTRTVELAPCLGLEMAHLSARGFGAARVAEASAVTVAPEAAMTVAVPLGRGFGLRGGLGGAVPMSRNSFVITASGTVHEPAAVALRGWLGPEVHF